MVTSAPTTSVPTTSASDLNRNSYNKEKNILYNKSKSHTSQNTNRYKKFEIIIVFYDMTLEHNKQ